MTQARQSEPPSAGAGTASNIFLVGRNGRGHWVVRDVRGLRGGFFVDRSKAIRFAMDETGRRPQAIRLVTGTLELDLSLTAEPRPLPARASRGLIAPVDSGSFPVTAREVQP
jgi:hypothetical protein